MEFNKFREIIKKRATIDSNWDFGVEQCWNEMIALFSANIDKTIRFLEICTADEFFWMSEIFDRITEETCSKEFIAALHRAADKYHEMAKKYHIIEDIELCEGILDYKLWEREEKMKGNL